MSTTEVLGKTVGMMGYGLMGLSMHGKEGSKPLPEVIAAMKLALERGSNFWNAGQFYGPPDWNSLHILREYFTQYPEDASKVVISIKGAFDIPTARPDGSPEGVRKSVEACYEMLKGIKTIDIFECARVDPDVPIETTIKALAELVKEGKIGGIGLSEVNGNTVRRAAAVHPIASVEIEFGIWASDMLGEKTSIGKACSELDIPILAYSPLGRGILAGEIRRLEDLPEGDYRHHDPRYQPDTFPTNLKLVDAVNAIATRKGVTPAQVALAWVQAFNTIDPATTFPLTQTHSRLRVIPIPGATTEKRILENTAPDVTLTEEEFREINDLVKKFAVKGERYGGPLQKLMDL